MLFRSFANQVGDTLSTRRKSILKQGKSISVGEFVEAELQKQKEEGGVSYREVKLRRVKGRVS